MLTLYDRTVGVVCLEKGGASRWLLCRNVCPIAACIWRNSRLYLNLAGIRDWT